MTQTNFPRARLSASPADIIKALPGMARIMINTRWGGATHERMGVVETVTEADGWLVCAGAEHASRIDPALITAVIVDRTSIMGGNPYPRIDFMLDDDEVLCSAISFAGLEPFDAALSPFGPGTELPLVERTPPSTAPAAETDVRDPGCFPFESALASAQPVAVRIARPGFAAEWVGIVEKVSPSRGFINVMRPDFHLHLKAGAVAGWRHETSGAETIMVALNGKGQPTGLTVHGTAAAFASIPELAEIA